MATHRISLLFTYLGFAGFIRREADVPQQFMWAMPWMLFFALTVGFGQIVFVYNLFHTLKRKKPTKEELQFELDKRYRTEEEEEHVHPARSQDIKHLHMDKDTGLHYAGVQQPDWLVYCTLSLYPILSDLVLIQQYFL